MLITVLIVGIAIQAALTGLELSRFNNAKNASLESVLYENVRQGQAIETAILKLKFVKRHDSVIAFAGLHHQSNGRHVLFVDWVSYKSGADSMLIALNDGRSITCALNALECHHSNVYYHHSILLDEFGLEDGTEIKHVGLGRDGNPISDSIAPEKWIVSWL